MHDDELIKLEKLFHKRVSRKELAEEFNTTISSISNNLSKLGLSLKSKKWTDEEIQKLIEYNNKEILIEKQVELIGRSKAAIWSKRWELGITFEKSCEHKLKQIEKVCEGIKSYNNEFKDVDNCVVLADEIIEIIGE